MAKRTATSALNPENWDKEEEAEEPGIFQVAPSEVLQTRIIKTAKRHLRASDNSSVTKSSPFLGFTGFGKATSTSNAASPFSFLNQNKSKMNDGEKNGREGENLSNLTKDSTSQSKSLTSSSLSSAQLQNDNFSNFTVGLEKQSAATTDSKFKPFEHIFKSTTPQNQSNEKKSQNLESLKDLNISCSNWIKEHLEKNPYCILTPIFKDYQKHLVHLNLDVENSEGDEKAETEKSNTDVSRESNSSREESNQESKKDEETEKSNEFKLGDCQPVKPFNVQFGSVGNASFASSPSPFNPNGVQSVAANLSNPEAESMKDDDESEEPPKVDFVPVEEDSTFDMRCKIFVKKDGSFVSRGIGTLFLKPVKDGNRTQVIVRAHTSLKNILLNILLVPGMPIQKVAKTNVMIACVPTPDSKPPPVPVLIRVKTSEECDVLAAKLEECRGS